MSLAPERPRTGPSCATRASSTRSWASSTESSRTRRRTAAWARSGRTCQPAPSPSRSSDAVWVGGASLTSSLPGLCCSASRAALSPRRARPGRGAETLSVPAQYAGAALRRCQRGRRGSRQWRTREPGGVRRVTRAVRGRVESSQRRQDSSRRGPPKTGRGAAPSAGRRARTPAEEDVGSRGAAVARHDSSSVRWSTGAAAAGVRSPRGGSGCGRGRPGGRVSGLTAAVIDC